MRVPSLGGEDPLEEGGHGNPLQYPCLENPHRQRSLAGYSPWVRIELDTSEAPQHAHAHKPETNALICVPSQEKAAFRELIAQLELDPKCRGLPLSSFLILPFQRITRLKLLVQVPDSLPLHPPHSHFSCCPFPSVSPGLCWLSEKSMCSTDPK